MSVHHQYSIDETIPQGLSKLRRQVLIEAGLLSPPEKPTEKPTPRSEGTVNNSGLECTLCVIEDIILQKLSQPLTLLHLHVKRYT